MESLVAENLFGGIYKGKTVLVTGHTGFKGSWLSFWLKKMGANVVGFSNNQETTPSHFNLLELDIKSKIGDISDVDFLEKLFLEVKPEIVFHLAAQSLVRESYRSPVYTYATNVMGTLNVFEASRKTSSVKAIVNVTTDKVYENLELSKSFKEEDKLGGYDIYSSSKACSELLTASYRNALLNNTILLGSARAGNVIGGGDWANERLIPDIIRGLTTKTPTEIRSPKSVRPWEHVLEPLSGYLLLGQRLLEGEEEYARAWNFGPKPEHTLQVLEVIKLMQQEWDKVSYIVNEEEAKKFHEASILKLDCSKALKLLNWEPVWSLEMTIKKTVNWYKKYYEENTINTEGDLLEYIECAKENKMVWTY